MYTRYYPNKGLYFGGQQVMTPETVQRWTKQFKAGTKDLTGLVLKKPNQIAGGKCIGYRPEHQTYINIGRNEVIRGGNLIQQESSSFTPKSTPLIQTQSSSFSPRPSISTPSLYNTRPTTPSYPHIDPYGASTYLGLSYADLSREIERARFQRKLELLEDEYRKPRRKSTKRRKSSSKKRRKSSKKKRR